MPLGEDCRKERHENRYMKAGKRKDMRGAGITECGVNGLGKQRFIVEQQRAGKRSLRAEGRVERG